MLLKSFIEIAEFRVPSEYQLASPFLIYIFSLLFCQATPVNPLKKRSQGERPIWQVCIWKAQVETWEASGKSKTVPSFCPCALKRVFFFWLGAFGTQKHSCLCVQVALVPLKWSYQAVPHKELPHSSRPFEDLIHRSQKTPENLEDVILVNASLVFWQSFSQM